MRIEIKSEEEMKIVLDIVFWKTSPEERRRKNNQELIDTTCLILSNGREIARATAKQNSLDSYSKITGKKVALTKAINTIGFLKPVPEITGINLKRRSMRQHIWNVFHQTFGRWS